MVKSSEEMLYSYEELDSNLTPMTPADPEWIPLLQMINDGNNVRDNIAVHNIWRVEHLYEPVEEPVEGIVGFHGTLEDRVGSILKNGFIVRRNSGDFGATPIFEFAAHYCRLSKT